MQEFTITMIEPLVRGLRESSRKRFNSQRLTQARGVIVTPERMEGYEPVVDPIGAAVAWPFPQFLRGERISLLGLETTVEELDENTTPFGRSVLSLLNPATGGAAAIPGGGGSWHMADAGAAWYLTNGATVVYRTGLDAAAGTGIKTYANATPFSTCCFARGRFVLGGLSSTFWSALSSIFEAWEGAQPTGIDLSTTELGPNWVAWSSIGGGDLPLWLLYPTGYAYDLAATAARLVERFKENTLGWMPMSFRGAVQVVKPLGRNFVVYGTDGVDVLTSVAGSQLAEGAPTFGRITLFRGVGVPDRGAVGGDETGHVFLDSKGRLWRINADLQVTPLGYEEYLGGLVGYPMSVAHDTQENWFYLGGGAPASKKGFLLTGSGLTEVTERLTSGQHLEGGMIGVVEELPPASILLVTEEFDFSLRTIKRVNFVKLAVVSEAALSVAVDYRYNKSGAYARSRFVPVNKEGVAYLGVSGTEFRVVVAATSHEDFTLDYIEISYQTSDKRYLRGPNADSTGSRSGQQSLG